MGEVSLGGLSGAVTLLGAEVTCLVALRVPECGLTCVVQGVASSWREKGRGRRLSPPHELVCERLRWLGAVVLPRWK